MTAARPEPIPHGGDLTAARTRFAGAPEPWIDLSTGINPEPYPFAAPAAEIWSRLPQRSDEWALQTAAARRYRADRPQMVVCAPGTQALIQALPRLLSRGRVYVLGPTYGEHAAAWRRAGHDVSVGADVSAARDADVVVVVNPNNPTGRIVAPRVLREISARLDAAGGLLVVDEAFADVSAADASLVRDLPQSAIVLRSFGKMYGLAGIRLGFAIAHEELADRLREELGPWAVSGPALAVGAAALSDDAWLRESLAKLEHSRRRLDGLLVAGNCSVLGGTSLFRLAAHPNARHVGEVLGRHGLLVRHFQHEPTWLRFGLPAGESAWQRLEAALAAIQE